MGGAARHDVRDARPRRRVLGRTLSGAVDQVGAGVTDVAIGDEACVMTGSRWGEHAQYDVVVDFVGNVGIGPGAGMLRPEDALLLAGIATEDRSDIAICCGSWPAES